MVIPLRVQTDVCTYLFFFYAKDCHCRWWNGASGITCDDTTGQCECNVGYTGKQCNHCQSGYFADGSKCSGK